MELASKYSPADVEAKWYQYWLDHHLFSSKPDSREPYTVVIPPPNVTGVLHMGHMLNNTIQDILVRRARMVGKNACWVPGTDHASIATEAKVVNKLAAQGIKKSDLTREEFLKHAWAWTEEHGGIILKQLRKLGASCDWDRTAFTMDEKRSQSVIKVFVDLYNKGLIYRGVRMVNWDPKALTALSDEEVIYKEEHGKLYYLRYRVEGDPENRYAVVATTRPETIMGDTAMCINPNDPKNAWLKGKKVIVPLVNRVIPVIEDDYVDVEFGTGCLKVTPAHDVNDYMLGEKHNLPSIDIFNDDGTLSEAAGLYVGMDRFDVRKQIVEDLDAAGLLERAEPYTNKVGYSERTNVVIEPKLSMQWFLRMKHFADMALPPVMNDELKFYPPKYKNIYRHWMENIKDWCISRQIWWGHRIPAWYNEKNEVYVGVNPPEGDNWHQDEDVLDTWFSSWLWPFSIMGWPKDTPEQKYFYPTNDLVTGPDIIFFWVARMIMAGYEFKGAPPFRNVYFTSIIRDDLGRKLSKSLGNSPDPLDVIARYGADALRFSIIYIAPIGMDIRYANEKCEIGRNFANKLWNACRFRKMQGDVSPNFRKLEGIDPAKLAPDEKWILAWTDRTVGSAREALEGFKFHQAAHDIYEMVWSTFCDWFIESCKPRLYGDPEEKKQTLAVLDFVLWKLLRLLHPFMPFVTEELAHQMDFLKENESIMYAHYPETLEKLGLGALADGLDTVLGLVDDKFQLVRAGRNLRISYDIAPGKKLKYHVKAATETQEAFLRNEIGNLKFLLNAEEVTVSQEDYRAEDGSGAPSALVNAGAIFLPLKGVIDVEAETAKLNKQKKELLGWIKGSEAKLGNPGFLAKAPPKVVEDAKTHLAEMKEKLARVEEALKSLNG